MTAVVGPKSFQQLGILQNSPKLLGTVKGAQDALIPQTAHETPMSFQGGSTPI